MIHHMQNMQGRLGNISTQNVNQDDNLKGLEKEAYQLGNILLRSWENSQDKINEIKVQPGKTGVVAPLTSEEKEWIKKQLRDFDPGDTPPNDPDKPLTYTFMNEGWIEDYIEDEDMTSKDLEIFKSIVKKLGKSKVYTFNNGHDSKVDSTPHLHDSVIRANDNSELTVTWSDWGHDNPYPYGAFGKNTGKYIKYSDLNEIKAQPGRTGVNFPLTQEEKNWIDNELYVLDRYYPPNQTSPDTPVEYVFATKKWIESDIEDGYKDYKDLEIFNSIYQKLKNKIYIFNFGHDPKIKNYPESYDLRDAVVRADFENNNPELTVTLSDRADGSYGSEYGAFDKDTGEYLKYSDLDKIGKIV
jgi:hypothetical protein